MYSALGSVVSLCPVIDGAVDGKLCTVVTAKQRSTVTLCVILIISIANTPGRIPEAYALGLQHLEGLGRIRVDLVGVGNNEAGLGILDRAKPTVCYELNIVGARRVSLGGQLCAWVDLRPRDRDVKEVVPALDLGDYLMDGRLGNE